MTVCVDKNQNILFGFVPGFNHTDRLEFKISNPFPPFLKAKTIWQNQHTCKKQSALPHLHLCLGRKKKVSSPNSNPDPSGTRCVFWTAWHICLHSQLSDPSTHKKSSTHSAAILGVWISHTDKLLLRLYNSQIGIQLKKNPEP